MPATKKPTALIYARLSLADRLPDGSLDAEAVERQERSCRSLARRRGYRVVDVIVDNDRSASRYSRRRRGGFERVVLAMRSGEVDAVLISHLDRLTRQPKEVEQLIDLVESSGVVIEAVDGILDLASDNGRAMARVATAFAAHASDATSRRMKSQRRDRAERGRPVRTVDGFGWARDVPVPAEADAIRDAMTAVIAGSTLAGIARDWQARGLRRRRSSAPWRSHDVRVVLLNERHSGRAVYRGDVVSEIEGPAIVERELHERVIELLSDPARSTGPRRRRALSGVLRCGRCGAVLSRGPIGTPRRDGWRCSTATGCGGLTISAAPVEEVVIEAVLRLFDGGELPSSAPAVDSEALAVVRQLDEELRQLGKAHGDGDIPLPAFIEASKRLAARREEAARRLMPSRRSAALSAYSKPGALRAAWPALDEEARNVVIRNVVEAVVIEPAAPAVKDPIARIGAISWLA